MKDFNMKGMLTILLGVISLIVVIPVINNFMSPDEPPLEEYHLIFNYDQDYSFTLNDQDETFDITTHYQNWPDYDIGGGLYQVKYENDILTYFIKSVSIIDEIIYIGDPDEIGIADGFSLTSIMSYGIYDFSDWVYIGNEIITPIYTPF